MLKKLSVFALVSSLSACASLSEEECQLGDWHGIGYSDGLAGKALGQLSKHQEACSKYQVQVGFDAYHQGRNNGLRSYCQASNGFQQGVKGATYANVCPADLAAGFIEQYQRGLAIYNQQQKLQAIERDISETEDKLDELQQDLYKKGQELIAKGKSSEQRASLLIEMQSIREQINTAQQSKNFNQSRLLQEQNYLQSLY